MGVIRAGVFCVVLLSVLVCQCLGHGHGSKNKHKEHTIVEIIEESDEHVPRRPPPPPPPPKQPKPEVLEIEIVEKPIFVKPPVHHPGPFCDQNEKWYSCLPSCSITCDNISRKCTAKQKRCKQGCDCKSGYARLTKRGPCLSVRHCPIPEPEDPCGRNEEWLDCGEAPYCDRTCANIGQPCNRQTFSCPKGCFCKSGYARDLETNVCIKIKSCPPVTPTCDRHEEFNSCGFDCSESCDEDLCKLSLTDKCKSGCFCEKGYARVNGKCVQRDQCSDPCGKNEVFSECGNQCNEQCGSGILCPQVCQKGCFCKPGHFRANGKCVPKQDCPPTSTCGRNEVWLGCGDAPNCDRTCDTLGETCTIIHIKCPEGCYCKSGYARDPQTNQCIKTRDCPSKECRGTNEIFKACGSDCDEQCDSNSVCTEQCSEGCFCKRNFVRINGQCVPKDKCSQSCDRNQVYNSCGLRCKENCDDTLCLRVREICQPGCFCKDGYKDVNGKCLPPGQCSTDIVTEECAENEIFKRCGNNCDEKCDHSLSDCTKSCRRGCFCLNGYVRIDRKCVKRRECKKQCKANEIFTDCGNTCEESCPFTGRICPEACEEGCFCDKDHARFGDMCIPKWHCDTPGSS